MTVTPEEILRTVSGVDRVDAEFIADLENGEVDGDIIVVSDDAPEEADG